MSACGCLDTRVWGHVCARSGPPPGDGANAWRSLPGLRDPAPRPAPESDGFDLFIDHRRRARLEAGGTP